MFGLDQPVPIFGGRSRPCVSVDNAATTPPFREVVEEVTAFLPWYGSVHRGAGPKSVACTQRYAKCREMVAAWVGADLEHHTVIFTRSATDSINKLARTLAPGRPHVLATVMEHHSNYLPWRAYCRLEAVETRSADGALDMDDFERRLRRAEGSVRLVTVTGASNVTGLAPALGPIARLAHQYGAEFCVDAAQLVAHRAIRMGSADDPERIDYLVFSGHKMYAPFGTGVLIGPRAVFEREQPESAGGGTVKMVTDDDVIWAPAPEREEAGTPNIVGVVALAKAIEVLQGIGMEQVAAHDRELNTLMRDALSRIPGVRLSGQVRPADHDQVGVVSFTAETMNHSLLAAALGHKWGIELRHGCFCAHPYIIRLLGVTEAQLEEYREQVRGGDFSHLPGLVRISLGVHNTPEDVEYVAAAVRSVLETGPRARYRMHTASGQYQPENGAAGSPPHVSF